MNQGNHGRFDKLESGNTQTNVQPSRSRSTAGLWVTLAVLSAALLGLAAYSYLTLAKHNIQLSELPGLTESVALLGDRLTAAETRLRTWAADWDQLDARLEKMDRRINYTRELARSEAKKAATELKASLDAQLEEQNQAVDARLTLLETSQQGDRDRLAQLREEIAGVRRASGHDLSALQDQVARGERNLDRLARDLERERVDFELAKNNTYEIAPGVSLRVTKTNVRFQRVKGWLWLMPDRRTIWIRGLGAQEALTFYHKNSDKPVELVITSVSRDAVAGYLMQPVVREVTLSSAPRRDPFAPAGSTTPAAASGEASSEAVPTQ